MCDLILSLYLGLVLLLLISILIYIYVELVESYDDLNLIVEKIKYERGEIMERPNKYDFDFAEDYESNLETYCDELEAIVSKGDCISHCEDEIQRLEKALDNACELISSDICINCYACYFEKECKYKEADKCIANNMNKEEWKEWCMKNE